MKSEHMGGGFLIEIMQFIYIHNLQYRGITKGIIKCACATVFLSLSAPLLILVENSPENEQPSGLNLQLLKVTGVPHDWLLVFLEIQKAKTYSTQVKLASVMCHGLSL